PGDDRGRWIFLAVVRLDLAIHQWADIQDVIFLGITTDKNYLNILAKFKLNVAGKALPVDLEEAR
ncbi:hypothetical protein ACJX0J_018712, partial [Zea mays]